MPKIKEDILKFLKRNDLQRFMVFVLLAFVFLMISKFSSDYRRTIPIAVTIKNLPKDIVLDKDGTRIIDLVVEAKGFSFLSLWLEESPSLVLNAEKDVSKTSRYFVVDVQKNNYLIEAQLGDAFKVITAKPDSLKLSYSVLKSRNVPIKLNEAVNYAIGYDSYKGLQLRVDSVKVIGPENVIDTLKHIETEIIKRSEVKSDIQETLQLKSLPELQVKLVPDFVIVESKVRRFTEGTLEVPVSVINLPEDSNINYFPKVVQVSYYVALDDFKKVKPSDFRVVCDFSKINEEASYLSAELEVIAPFIKRATLKTDRVDFIILQ